MTPGQAGGGGVPTAAQATTWKERTMRNRGRGLVGWIVVVAAVLGPVGCDLDDTRSPSNPPPSAPPPPPPAPQTPPKAAGRGTIVAPATESVFLAGTVPLTSQPA